MGYLKLDPFEEVQSIDWLVLAEQRLLSVAKGAVFFDGLGELEKVRDKFSYFPHDVWLFLLASQWGNGGHIYCGLSSGSGMWND